MNCDYASPISINRRGIMLIISSPSGVGKSTIANHILGSDKNFEMSISVTTRSCRPNEIDGKDYHFVDVNRFNELRMSDSFIEWAEVHGNFYGTLRDPINKTISQGKDMIFDIDCQGAYNLQKYMKSDIVSFFILPPTMSELRSRLRFRAEKNLESNETVQLRLKNAHSEIERWSDYDYVIVNDDLETSLRTLDIVIKAERMRRYRLYDGISYFIDGLLKEDL